MVVDMLNRKRKKKSIFGNVELKEEDKKLVLETTYSQGVIRLKNKLEEIKSVLNGIKKNAINITDEYKWFSFEYEELEQVNKPYQIPLLADIEGNYIDIAEGACCCEEDFGYGHLSVAFSKATIINALEFECVQIENKIKEYTEKLNEL